ncbi:NUDIX hydrolase [Phytoactinopolyspora halotolerans]|uniref:NUDIX domain-containing protein n=1 Tax=Phytoactinopolyspora halotolerans TaxID=1981512 RepID=A0A6L9S0X3_9ACTN|nr:NUDIX domain-containing protein [Phytoactinopolyspora halotolerans]NED98598.1 NUDIX domain-containing protein [Phytoactinopolyspora halotolerans]
MLPERPEDELLDVVDEADRVIDQARRADVYARRLRHRSTFVLVRDGNGAIFVHRRTASKLVFPSHYDMFVGGVVRAGETYDDAAHREAEEELGVSGLPAPTPLLRFLYEDAQYAAWAAVYEVRCIGAVDPQAEEVAWHAFVPIDELETKLDVWPFTPDSLAALSRLRARGVV